MHRDNKTAKHVLFITDRRKYKATAKPWFSRLLRHPSRKRSGL